VPTRPAAWRHDKRKGRFGGMTDEIRLINTSPRTRFTLVLAHHYAETVKTNAIARADAFWMDLNAHSIVSGPVGSVALD
jgi:hypothetical protein